MQLDLKSMKSCWIQGLRLTGYLSKCHNNMYDVLIKIHLNTYYICCCDLCCLLICLYGYV